MFNLTTKSFATIILARNLFSGAVSAQDLDATVTCDPKANTCTYTFDLTGPPRGSAVLFVSPGLLPNPFPLPGLGDLYLNPLVLLPIGNIALDPKGKGARQITIPLRFVENTNLYFHAVVRDRGILRLTQNWCSGHLYEGPVDDTLTVGMTNNSKTQTYKGEMRGRPGKTVEIIHYRGGQLDIWHAGIPASGVLVVNWTYKNKLKHGDTIEIRYNGKRFMNWRR